MPRCSSLPWMPCPMKMRELEVSGRCDARLDATTRGGSPLRSAIETEVERLIGDGALNDIDFQMIEIEARRVADHGAGRRWEAQRRPL